MKIEDIGKQCWICRRTKEELEKPFEDDDFSIPLMEVTNSEYSGYHICNICNDILTSIGGPSGEYINTLIEERLDELKSNLIENIENL